METAKIIVDGKEFELPVVEGSEGEKAFDITSLRAMSGYVTIDNGFMNTGSCKSAITFLDGEKGILRYRGYPIEQLADRSTFMEVAYLLYFGELPTSIELDNLKQRMKKYTKLPEGIEQMIAHFPKDAHPMGVVSSVTSCLSAFYPEYLNTPLSTDQKDEAFAHLMMQIKIILSQFYRRTIGQKIIDSNSDLSYSEDFLQMMFAGEAKMTPAVSKALNILFILHADHEQNCSTSTVRVIGSSQANVFATISGGIDALWGQLHGGANQRVLEMLQQIDDAGGDYQLFINKAKDKNDPFKLMGFGHRVYKNFDPRATIIKDACDTILKELNVVDPLLDIAKGLEDVARSDSYFVDRHLYPNVDFYSGIIYKALGIPVNMFTAMFVLGRLPGWISQWKEMRDDNKLKISRPRQIYTGHNKRDYISIEKR